MAQTAPLFRAIDLDIGESRDVELSNGKTVRVELVSLRESRDPIRDAVRRAAVTVDIDGERTSLVSATYRLPQVIGEVRIDCPITRGYTEKSRGNDWALEKAARLRLWPAKGPLLRHGSFVYPAKQRWFASDTQMANVPTFVDAGEQPGSRSVYYHYGLDVGGVEGRVDVVAATNGLVVSSGLERLDGHAGTPVRPRYDVVYLLDERGWYYRYSHLLSIDRHIRPGARVRLGQKIGVLGKEGGSGGWSHLHFDISSKQPSGNWGIQEGYAFLWEAYRREHRPKVIAVARPHHVARTGERVDLHASRSWTEDGKPPRIHWRFSDGTSSTKTHVSRVYEKPGQYSEILRVEDASGNVAYDFAVVQVFDRERPKRLLTIHAAYSPTIDVRAGTEVTFAVRSFGASTGEIWDFGDGSPKVTVRSDGNKKKLAKDGYALTTHTFAKPGDYIVRVERALVDGQNAIAHLHVPVREGSFPRSTLDAKKIEARTLPPLVIDRKPVKAHTQGLLLTKDGLFVTARRDDVKPRRSLLLWLRGDTRQKIESWTKIWDVTPTSLPPGWENGLDHPGGLDSDGENLWIPLSHSRRDGKTLLRQFSIRALLETGEAAPRTTITVDDHIGAVAVSRDPVRLFGASWNTDYTYTWSPDGSHSTISLRDAFVRGSPDWSNAVQDWKVQGRWLIASGIDKSSSRPRNRPRAVIQAIDLETRRLVSELRLPRRLLVGPDTREGMAIFDDHVWLIPGDLGKTNRLYRFPLSELALPR